MVMHITKEKSVNLVYHVVWCNLKLIMVIDWWYIWLDDASCLPISSPLKKKKLIWLFHDIWYTIPKGQWQSSISYIQVHKTCTQYWPEVLWHAFNLFMIRVAQWYTELTWSCICIVELYWYHRAQLYTNTVYKITDRRLHMQGLSLFFFYFFYPPPPPTISLLCWFLRLSSPEW